MQTTEPADMVTWHKRFAIEANNRAWDLAIVPRTPTEDREMLDAAHSSAWHWSAIGTPGLRERDRGPCSHCQ